MEDSFPTIRVHIQFIDGSIFKKHDMSFDCCVIASSGKDNFEKDGDKFVYLGFAQVFHKSTFKKMVHDNGFDELLPEERFEYAAKGRNYVQGVHIKIQLGVDFCGLIV